MNFPFYIAKRYLFAKKSHNIINIISGISVAGITVGTMALIIVLSVFNGFEKLVTSLFSAFNPEIQITAKEGKTFDATVISAEDIKKIPGVIYYTEVVEENALLKYQSKQYIATIKGVNNDYSRMNRLDTMLIDGDFVLASDENDFAVVAQGVAYNLGIVLNDLTSPITVYMPKRAEHVSLDPSQAFNSKRILPTGVFSIQQDIDSKYMLVPLRFARELLDYKTEATAVEIGLSPVADKNKVQQQIQQLTGKNFVVKNRFQQEELLYKIMKSEKWAVFLILSFILLIATFNVIGSLTMLIIDKKKDIGILYSLGADNKLIKRIFLFEGLMISLFGAILGLLLGGLICWIQQKYGIISLQSSGSFVVSAYPVNMKITDFLYVLLTVFVIGYLAAWLPVRQIAKKFPPKKI